MIDYKSYQGFYDLRNFILTKRLFKKLWKIQDMLFHMQKNSIYFKKSHPLQWEKAKQVSAEYQQILFQQKKLLQQGGSK